MLAVTANWAVSDGSLASPRADLACAWLETVRVAAIRAGCGPDGRYRPIEKITLVFAGDTLDLLLTDLWTGRDRPWHGGRRVERRSTRRLPQLCGQLVACSASFATGFVMASWYPPPMAGGGRPKGFAIGQRLTSYSSWAIETVPSASWQARRQGLAFRLETHGLMAFTRFATATNSIRSDHHRSRRIGCLLRAPGRPWRRV